MAWVTEFDSRRLHEIVVELVVELMEHAVSHADDDEALSAFEQEMVEFDVAEFVDQYRAERDLEEDPYALSARPTAIRVWGSRILLKRRPRSVDQTPITTATAIVSDYCLTPVSLNPICSETVGKTYERR